MTEKVTEKAPDMEIMAKYHLRDEQVREQTLNSVTFRQIDRNFMDQIACVPFVHYNHCATESLHPALL